MNKEAMLYEKIGEGKLHCYLCYHHCTIGKSQYGFCGVRQNIDGKLHALAYGEVIASHIDPIEKKPLYHFLPGTSAYSIATLGCNFRCGFCQNWQISQISKRGGHDFASYELKPEEVVREAVKAGCKSISYTYTEPTIFFEYAYDTAKLAKAKGLYNNFVTNGYMTKEAIKSIRPYLDAANIDLKFFDDESYKRICHGHLKPVLDSIKLMKELGIWVEVTTLVIPGLNDSERELKGIADFIASVGKEIPWHISRFHPDYKYTQTPPTSMATLKKAQDIGNKAGLRYIYLGNVLEGNNTYCYNCKTLLIERIGFDIAQRDFENGKCLKCSESIDGYFIEKKS